MAFLRSASGANEGGCARIVVDPKIAAMIRVANGMARRLLTERVLSTACDRTVVGDGDIRSCPVARPNPALNDARQAAASGQDNHSECCVGIWEDTSAAIERQERVGR